MAREHHAHRDAELYTALRTGMLKRRDARIVTISTAGADDDSALGELRRRALELPKVKRTASFTAATGPNLALLEWSLPDSASIDDMSAVKKVNPASWLSEADLAEQREAVHEMAFRRYHANQWVAGTESAISPTEWAACANPRCEVAEGADGVIVGVDLGWRHDCTALVPIWRESTEAPVRVHPPVILHPPGDGSSLDVTEIQGACELFLDRWPGLTFVLDPEAGGEQLAQWLDRELRVRVLTHSQRTAPMSRASQLLAEAIATGDLEHPDDPELTKHVLGAGARFVGVGWRFAKPKGSRAPIDAVIALAIGLRVLAASEQTPEPNPEGLRGPSSTAVIA